MTRERLSARCALILLVLASAPLRQAAAQAPEAPQVVIESNPANPAPPPAPASPAFTAPTVTIESNPAAPAAEAVVVPSPAAGPAFTSPTVIIESSPAAAAAPAPVAPPVPAPATAGAAVSPSPAPAVTTPTPDGIGTTIFGEQEAPIGLYITPWKDDYAERGLDRPARLIDEAMEPIDPATFRRQIEYYETITEFRRKQRGEAK